MRTTQTIDDDLLDAAKAIARRQHRSLGAVVSDLVRGGLSQPWGNSLRNGIPLLGPNDRRAAITLKIVNTRRDELP